MSSLLKRLLVFVTMFTIFTSNIYANNYGEIYPVNKDYVKYQKQFQDNDQYKYSEHTKLNKTILELANKLLLSSRINTSDFSDIAITSFVDLHQLNKTTHFGRTLSESMFDELFIRGFNVSEFRGQNTLSVNANGEYFITRDVNMLRNSVPNRYILVGTYTNFEKTMLINARIVDNDNGRIVASARSYYSSDDCSILENCKEPRKIKIVTDGCSTVNCPDRSCLRGICSNDITSNHYINNSSQRNSIRISSTKKSDNRIAKTTYSNQSLNLI
ncbi:MAG: FlgO family outer membrane protein, partial [Campylobacterota bacterium]|nr:FlgO family outer membrane protein [Campylobacterota bacterium]